MTHIVVSNESEHAVDSGVYPSPPTRRTNPRLHNLCLRPPGLSFSPEAGALFFLLFVRTRCPNGTERRRWEYPQGIMGPFFWRERSRAPRRDSRALKSAG